MTVYSDALRWRAMRALPRDLNSKLYVMCMQALQECDAGNVPEDALPLLNIEEKSFYALADRAGVDRRYKYRVYRAFKGLPFTNVEARRAKRDAAPRETGAGVAVVAAVTVKPPSGTALYRWYDERDRLLYIGISDGLTGRVSDHVSGSSWMDFAARSTIERIADRSEAERAEIAAIKAEHPLFNHQHNNTPEARRRLVEYLIERDRLDLLAPAVSRGRVARAS
jgi:predicted GIY-YIG superfamily endonuclease